MEHLKGKIMKITYFKGDGEAICRNYTLSERLIKMQTGEDEIKLKPNAGAQLITAWDVRAKQWKQITLATTQWDTVEVIRVVPSQPEETVADLQLQVRALKIQVYNLAGSVLTKPGGPKLGGFTLNSDWYVERAKRHIFEQRDMIDSDFDLTKTPDQATVENIVFRLWKDMKAKLNADDVSIGTGYYKIKDSEFTAVHKIALLFHK